MIWGVAMLVIRKPQWEVIDKDIHENRFVDRLRAAMIATYPETCARIGEDGVLKRVNEAIRIADRHQITTAGNIRRLAHLLFLLDMDTPETDGPWVLDILGWEDTDEDFRMAALEKRARELISHID